MLQLSNRAATNIQKGKLVLVLIKLYLQGFISTVVTVYNCTYNFSSSTVRPCITAGFYESGRYRIPVNVGRYLPQWLSVYTYSDVLETYVP